MTLKTRVEGTIIEVGWEPNTPKTQRVYAIIKVKLASLRRQDLAEEQLQKLTQKILNKKVVLFPQ